MSRIEARLGELGVTLPVPAAPVASYVPFVISGNLLTISGQLPMCDGVPLIRGRLGETVSIEEGQQAARICFINLLAQMRAALGDLDRVTRIVRLGGFIAATPEFGAHAQAMNGASDLAMAVFGAAGQHARATVGVASLPLNAAVEIEALVEFA